MRTKNAPKRSLFVNYPSSKFWRALCIFGLRRPDLSGPDKTFQPTGHMVHKIRVTGYFLTEAQT